MSDDYPQNITLSNMTDYTQTITITKDEYYRLTNAYNSRCNSLVEKFALALTSGCSAFGEIPNPEWVTAQAEHCANALLESEEKRKAQV